MIDDLEDPRMKQAENGLTAVLAAFQWRPLSSNTMTALIEAVRDHRKRWRQRGVDFPHLVPLVNRRRGTIDLVRADLERKDIITTIRNFIIKNPDLSVIEVTQAIKFAWPDLRKGFLFDTSEDYQDRMVRSLIRQATEPQTADVDTDQQLVDQAIEMDPSLGEYYSEVEK